MIVEIPDGLPLMDLRPRPQGEWIELREYDNKCSICGQTMMDKWDYCPNCGADMRGGAT